MVFPGPLSCGDCRPLIPLLGGCTPEPLPLSLARRTPIVALLPVTEVERLPVCYPLWQGEASPD